MDVAAADAFARKKLRQVPRLNKKVQNARVINDYKGTAARVNAELAAAQARLAQLKQATVAPAGRLTAGISELQQPSTARQQTTSSKGHSVDFKQECKQQLRQVCQHAGVSAVAQAPNSTDTQGTSSKPPVQLQLANRASAAGLAAAAAAAVNPPLILPARASVGRLDTAFVSATCTSSAQPGGKYSSRSTSSSNGGSIAACSHRSRSSSGSSCSQEQQQKQQQLAAADGILAQINEYMAAEVPQADAAVQNLLLLQQQQQQQAAAAAAAASGVPNGPQVKDSSNTAATTNAKRPSGSGAVASSLAGDAAAKAAALQALGIDSDSYTPELLASLAMRFQAYNLPPGLNSMPDLGTIALAMKQQEQKAAQQRQHEQQEWLLQQERQQLARQSAADRHLQLYQLGVMQQRARLQQGSSLVSPACVTAASYRLQGQQMLWQQQQQQLCDAVCQSSTGAEKQYLPVLDPGQHSPGRHVRFSSAGQDAAAAAATAGGAPEADTPQAAVTEPAAVSATGAPVTQASATAATDAATPVAEPIRSSTMPASSQQQQTGNAALSSGQQQNKQQHACNINQPQQAASAAGRCQAAVAAPNSQTISSTSTTALLHQNLPDQAARPPQRRYKSDMPGVFAGASHGHLSPAGLSFNHLPGSRRQVYARIQDALACSDAISEAEQSLRALTYAPCSRPAAAGTL